MLIEITKSERLNQIHRVETILKNYNVRFVRVGVRENI